MRGKNILLSLPLASFNQPLFVFFVAFVANFLATAEKLRTGQKTAFFAVFAAIIIAVFEFN